MFFYNRCSLCLTFSYAEKHPLVSPVRLQSFSCFCVKRRRKTNLYFWVFSGHGPFINQRWCHRFLQEIVEFFFVMRRFRSRRFNDNVKLTICQMEEGSFRVLLTHCVCKCVCEHTADGIGKFEVCIQQPHAFTVQKLIGWQDFSQHASAELERLQQLLKRLTA